MADVTTQSKRARDEADSPAAKRLREVLLDDSDTVTGRDSDIHDLDSVMKSFEQELSGNNNNSVVDLTSDSGDSLPEFGYLQEASDDELGLPSAAVAEDNNEEDLAAELVRAEAESSGRGFDSFGFGGGMPSYGDSFGLAELTESNGVGCPYDVNNNGVGGDYVALDGIFDYPDVGFGPYDYSDLLWRPETLPAV